MGLRLKNSSSNYVQLNAPSSIASDFSLTLPGDDGDASQFLQTNGSGVLSWASDPTLGRVLQTVSGTSNTQSDTSSTSFVTTGFSLSITPSATSSKILIFCNTSSSPNTAGHGAFAVVQQGGTNVTNISVVYNDSSAADTWRSVFLFGIDSPSSTSSVTYELFHRSQYSTGTVYNNWGGGAPNQMILMELGQ